MNFTFEHIFAKATVAAINNTDWMFLMEHKNDIKEPLYYRNDMKYAEVHAYMQLFEEMNTEQNPIVMEFPISP